MEGVDEGCIPAADDLTPLDADHVWTGTGVTEPSSICCEIHLILLVIQPVAFSRCSASACMKSHHDPIRPSGRERLHESTACRICGHEIGPRDRRLTWRIREGEDVFEYHYCSAGCLPETAPDR